LAQARGLGLPVYRVVSSEGPEHARTFTIEVSVNGQLLGGGVGSRTLDAEREAAEEALDALIKKRSDDR
jgi:ribonuclease-3